MIPREQCDQAADWLGDGNTTAIRAVMAAVDPESGHCGGAYIKLMNGDMVCLNKLEVARLIGNLLEVAELFAAPEKKARPPSKALS